MGGDDCGGFGAEDVFGKLCGNGVIFGLKKFDLFWGESRFGADNETGGFR